MRIRLTTREKCLGSLGASEIGGQFRPWHHCAAVIGRIGRCVNHTQPKFQKHENGQPPRRAIPANSETRGLRVLARLVVAHESYITLHNGFDKRCKCSPIRLIFELTGHVCSKLKTLTIVMDDYILVANITSSQSASLSTSPLEPLPALSAPSIALQPSFL